MLKRIFALLLVPALAMATNPNPQREVLVLHTAAVSITRRTGSKGFELFNHGPNPIFCTYGATAVEDTARPIAPGGSWAADIPAPILVSCIAATADQLTTRGTIFSEAM